MITEGGTLTKSIHLAKEEILIQARDKVNEVHYAPAPD